MEIPTKKQKKELLKLGYSEVIIRDIPVGIVINKDNWDNFPLISCNTFLHEDKIRQIDYVDEWRMLYVTNEPSLDLLNGSWITAPTLNELIFKLENGK